MAALLRMMDTCTLAVVVLMNVELDRVHRTRDLGGHMKRWLLHLYPQPFRRRCEDDAMCLSAGWCRSNERMARVDDQT